MKGPSDCPWDLPLVPFTKEDETYGVRYISWRDKSSNHSYDTNAACHSGMNSVGHLKGNGPLQHITRLPHKSTRGRDFLPWYKFLEDIPTFKLLKSSSTHLYSEDGKIVGLYFDDISEDNHPLLQAKLVTHRMAWELPYGCDAVMKLAENYPWEHRGFFLRFLYSLGYDGLFKVPNVRSHMFFRPENVGGAIGTGDLPLLPNREVSAAKGYHGVSELFSRKGTTNLRTDLHFRMFDFATSCFGNNRELLDQNSVAKVVDREYDIFKKEYLGV